MNNNNLFELLREKRNQIAKENKLEPFMVLHNSVLEEIAQKQPKTLEALSTIKGMGEKRLNKYGKFLLETVNGSSFQNDVEEREEEQVFSVSLYLDYLNKILVPQAAIIQGEIGKIDNRGRYAFFSLVDKNADAVINCFAWEENLRGFGIELKEGLEIRVKGFPRIFKPRGSFTFEVEYVSLVGEGSLKLAFERLKKQLEGQGYFAKERKKQIPEYVQTIGLITSRHGDAINDFMTHLGHFGFKIYFCNTRVEGFYAVDEITSAIRWFNENKFDIDALVLTRGGGSLESLQAFNSEPIAKAIFGSRIPIVTGIGHENDDTIADFVADIRASTPTHAARILSDPWRNAEKTVIICQRSIISIFKTKCQTLVGVVNSFQDSFHYAIKNLLRFRNQEIVAAETKLQMSFQNFIDELKSKSEAFRNNWQKLQIHLLLIQQRIKEQEVVLQDEVGRWFKAKETYLLQAEQRLMLSDPTLRLKQGYGIIFNVGNKVIKSIRQIRIGEKLRVKFYEGSAVSRVEETHS